MNVNISSAAQQIFGKSELIIITERVDDVALLIGQMIRMEYPDILDKHIPKNGKQRELSWGWTATVWLAYILSEGDHRKVSVAEYIAGMSNTLSAVTGQTIEVLDFDDDRLSHLLKHLSKRKIWQAIEHDLNHRSISVYELETDVIRCDPTTVSGYHKITESGLMQFGHSKDDPSLPQIKLAAASLDPLGMPLASEVVSGESADDGLYLGLIERVDKSLGKPSLLFVGDCKMSALENRLQIAASGHRYLSPLPLTGSTAQEMPDWIKKGLDKDRTGELAPIFRENDRGETVLAGCAYEFERKQSVPVEDEEIRWEERVLVVCSPAHAEQQSKGLEQRLTTAREKIAALTPSVGRGKRQVTDEATLQTRIEQIIKAQRVEGMLHVEYERQSESQTRYVGKGRGSANREQRTIEKVRYQINAVKRDEQAIETAKRNFGWKAFVTNATESALSLEDAILCYRNEYRIERIFNRLKSRLNIAPLFVKRDEQIEGMTYLLMLGVRVLTLVEFVVRRSLQADNAKLPGLHPENRTKETEKPTAERILKAFSGMTLTIIQDASGQELLRHLPALSAVQQAVLDRLGLDSVYAQFQNSR